MHCLNPHSETRPWCAIDRTRPLLCAKHSIYTVYSAGYPPLPRFLSRLRAGAMFRRELARTAAQSGRSRAASQWAVDAP